MSDSSATPWTVALQTPQLMGFPRQGYWSGLPFPSSGNLPDSGIESASPALAGISLPLSQQEILSLRRLLASAYPKRTHVHWDP